MITRIQLSSGNLFYHRAATGSEVAIACIVSRNNQFLGGYAGKEADRKLSIFRKIGTSVTESGITYAQGYAETINVQFPVISRLDMSLFNSWIGTASLLIEKYGDLFISDADSDAACACPDRERYYRTVGLAEELWDRGKSIPLWAFVANHLSIFSKENFRETFFRGYDLDSTDRDLTVMQKYCRTRYDSCGFKAPAAYLRLLVSNL